MAKSTKIDYIPLFAKYERGEITATQIAKEYGVNRSSFLQCFKRYKDGIDKTINNNVNDCLNKSVEAFKNATENIKAKEQKAQKLKGEKKEILEKEILENKNMLLTNYEILEKHHGQLVQATISVVSKGIRKANELLELAENAGEYQAVMSGLKSSVEMIGLFPKAPLVAIQNNLNASADKDKGAKPFDIKVNFLQPKKDKKDDDIINAEVLDD